LEPTIATDEILAAGWFPIHFFAVRRGVSTSAYLSSDGRPANLGERRRLARNIMAEAEAEAVAVFNVEFTHEIFLIADRANDFDAFGLVFR